MIKHLKLTYLTILFIILLPLSGNILLAQEDSILLQKIRNIEVSINDLQNEEELLYTPDVSFESFYDELSPYGEWILISKEELVKENKDGEGEGLASFFVIDDDMLFIWKPAGVENNWRPYSNGNWEYTNQGWLWNSDYSWGWAPFHYGRWISSKEYGWVWIPGYVWAPAWVVWNISENHVGWCALNPDAKWLGEDGVNSEAYKIKNKNEDFVFTEKSNFLNQLSGSNIVDNKQNSKLINTSKSKLDIKIENNRVINSGPEVKDIEKATGRNIKAREIFQKQQKGKYDKTENTVTVYKEKFSKVSIKEAKDKNLKKHPPKKFKKSKKVKNNLHKRKLHHKTIRHKH